MNTPQSADSRFNSQAPEFCPWNVTNSGSRFACLDSSVHTNDTSSRTGSRSITKEARGRSQSLSIQLEARRPVFRVKVSNFNPDFNKSEFVELVNSQFSDIKSIDFQPRYNEKGRLYGFVTFESEIGYEECIKLGTFQFGEDLLRIEPSQDKGCMPTSTTLVFSNLPVMTTESDFKEWITKIDVHPLSFSFIAANHHTHVFSGSVFVQYRNIEDAGVAWGYLKDEIFGSNKISVEFKKRQDKREMEDGNQTLFMDDKAKQIWNQMVTFKRTYVNSHVTPMPALVFPQDLSAFEKSVVFTYTEKLGLCHYTQGEGSEKHILISTTPPAAAAAAAAAAANQNATHAARSGRSSRSGSVSNEKAVETQSSQRRPRRMSCPNFAETHSASHAVKSTEKPTVPTTSQQRIATGPENDSKGFILKRTM